MKRASTREREEEGEWGRGREKVGGTRELAEVRKSRRFTAGRRWEGEKVEKGKENMEEKAEGKGK